MHNLTKIRIFRIALYITYPLAFILLYLPACCRRKKTTAVFFYFDRYVIGGAQRITLAILESVKDIPKNVYFTRRSANTGLLDAFNAVPGAVNRDVHFWCDHLLFRLFTVHYFAFYLNRHPDAVILSSNSTFFYDMLPFLGKHVKTIELLHNFTFGKKGMEFFGLANHRYLSCRMITDTATGARIREQYQQYHVPPGYLDRVMLAEFGVQLPPLCMKDFSLPLKIIYAGRGGSQKRVWLISRVAEYFINSKEPVEFHFAGTMTDDLSPAVKKHCHIHGELSEKEALDQLYQKQHVVILTSAYEGFPVVIKEVMMYGCVPLVTALAEIKTHLSHLNNALLVDEIEDEEAVVAKAVSCIRLLISDPALLAQLSGNARRYGEANFTRDNFMRICRNLLTTPVVSHTS